MTATILFTIVYNLPNNIIMELKRCNIFTHEKSQHHYLDIWLGIKANIFECLKIENFPVANESIVDKPISSCLMVLLRFPIL